MHAKRRCKKCGTHPDEWDPDKGGSRTAYKVGYGICFGCAAAERFADEHAKDHRVRGSYTTMLPGGA